MATNHSTGPEDRKRKEMKMNIKKGLVILGLGALLVGGLIPFAAKTVSAADISKWDPKLATKTTTAAGSSISCFTIPTEVAADIQKALSEPGIDVSLEVMMGLDKRVVGAKFDDIPAAQVMDLVKHSCVGREINEMDEAMMMLMKGDKNGFLETMGFTNPKALGPDYIGQIFGSSPKDLLDPAARLDRLFGDMGIGADVKTEKELPDFTSGPVGSSRPIGTMTMDVRSVDCEDGDCQVGPDDSDKELAGADIIDQNSSKDEDGNTRNDATIQLEYKDGSSRLVDLSTTRSADGASMTTVLVKDYDDQGNRTGTHMGIIVRAGDPRTQGGGYNTPDSGYIPMTEIPKAFWRPVILPVIGDGDPEFYGDSDFLKPADFGELQVWDPEPYADGSRGVVWALNNAVMVVWDPAPPM